MEELQSVVTIPEDHDFDGLTESERIVKKILEFDILDPVWFQVLRNHPELQVNADGKQVQLKRNHNLRQHFHTTYNHPLEDYYSDVKLIDQFLIGVGLHGKLSVWTTEMNLVTETPIRPELTEENSGVSAASFTVVKSVYTDSESTADSFNLSEDLLYRRGRMVLLALDLVTESMSPEEIAALQKKQKKGDPPLDLKPKRTVKYRIIVLDLFADEERKEVKLERVHDFYLDCMSDYQGLDVNFALSEFIQIDLAEDGRLCSLIINQAPALCHLYDFEQGKESIATTTAPAEGEEESPPAHSMKAPALVAIWKVEKKRDIKVIVKQMIIVTPKPTFAHNPFAVFNLNNNSAPPPPVKKTPVSTEAPVAAEPNHQQAPAHNNTVEFRRDVYQGVRLYPIFTEANYMSVLRLGVKPVEAPKPVNPDPKAKDKGKKEAEVVLSPSAMCPCIVYEESRWSLSANITAWSCFGESYKREIIVLGLANGKISMWDMRRNFLLATLGTHPSAITTIDTVYEAQLKVVNIICGSLDGSLTYYSNRSPEMNDDNSLDFVYTPNPLSSTKFVDYRGDVHKEAVVGVQFLSVNVSSDSYMNYVIMAQYSGGHIALYDSSNLALMNTLAQEEKVNYDPVHSIFLHGKNMPVKRYIIIDPEPEPVAEPAPAAGKKGAAPVPVEEPEPEPEPVVVEEVKDIVEIKSIDVEEVKSNVVHHGMGTNAFKILFTSRLNYLYTLNERAEKPYISVFRIDEALQQHQQRAKEETGFVWKVAPLPSRKGSNTAASMMSKASRMKGIPSTSNSVTTNNNNATSFKNLKLTEERLAQHELQYDPNAPTLRKKLSGWSSLQFNKQELQSIDPMELVKRDLLASKKERLNSNPKAKLNKTITNLASLCTM